MNRFMFWVFTGLTLTFGLLEILALPAVIEKNDWYDWSVVVVYVLAWANMAFALKRNEPNRLNISWAILMLVCTADNLFVYLHNHQAFNLILVWVFGLGTLFYGLQPKQETVK